MYVCYSGCLYVYAHVYVTVSARTRKRAGTGARARARAHEPRTCAREPGARAPQQGTRTLQTDTRSIGPRGLTQPGLERLDPPDMICPLGMSLSSCVLVVLRCWGRLRKSVFNMCYYLQVHFSKMNLTKRKRQIWKTEQYMTDTVF